MEYFHNLSNFLCYFPEETANVQHGNVTVSQSQRHTQVGYKSDMQHVLRISAGFYNSEQNFCCQDHKIIDTWMCLTKAVSFING